MSYAMSVAFQKGVYGILSGDAALTALVGTAVYDAAPDGPVPDLLVSLGTETVTCETDASGVIATHQFTVSVLAQDPGGFSRAKAAAGAVSEALQDAAPVLERGRVLSLDFQRAVARRVATGARRQIDLRFVARVEDT